MKLKHFAILFAAFVIGWLLASVTLGQIDGPGQTQAGTLAVFETDSPADWSVSPTQAATGMFFPDSTGTKLFFASPVAGEYEVNAAVIVDGKPKLFTLAFVNGTGGPAPVPVPTPEPEPITLADWVQANLPAEATASEIKTMQALFAQTASGIERGTIRTPDQAFSAIRTNAGRSVTWKTFLENLSKREELKIGNVKTLGKLFEEIAEGFKESPADSSLFSVPSSPLSCPDGNCPTPQKTTTSRRWR